MSRIIFYKGTSPSTPNVGQLALYAKTDGSVYIKNDTGTETQIGSTPNPTMSTLSDTALSSPSTGQVLKYNGTKWANAAVAYGELTGTPTLAAVATSGSYTDLTNKPTISTTLAGLTTDVVISSPTSGQILQYNGTKWANVASSSVGTTALSGLTSDVLLSSPANLQVLKYNGTNWVNAALTGSDISGVVLTTQVNASNGVAGLDATGKISSSLLPSSVTGSMNYQGVWNASTNSPTLVSGTGTKGYMYKVSVAGTTTIDGTSSWSVGDMIVFNGTTWDKIDGAASEVTSVAGRTGAVTLTLSDMTNIALASPANGQVLQFNGTNWINTTPSAGVTQLSLLTDVTLTSSSNTQVLKFNGSNWVNASVAYGEITGRPTLATVATSGAYTDLTGVPTLASVATSGSYTDLTSKPTIPTTVAALTGDVTISSATSGQTLRYDGTKWVNAQLQYGDLGGTAPAGGATNLGGLSDVNMVSPVVRNGNFLTYTSSDTSWHSTDLKSGVALSAGDSGKVISWSGTAWTLSAPSGGTTALSGLTTDVALTSLTNNQILKYSTASSKWVNAAVAYGEVTGTPTLATVATSGSYADLTSKPTIPTTLAALTGDVTITSAATNQMLQFNGTKWVNATVSLGIANVQADTAPALGGNLAVNGRSIVSASNGNITLAPNGTGVVDINGYQISPKATATTTTTSVFQSFVSTYGACFIDYLYKNSTNVKAGTLIVATDGTSVSVADTGAQIGTPTISFSAVVNGANIDVSQSGVSAGTLSWTMRRMV